MAWNLRGARNGACNGARCGAHAMAHAVAHEEALSEAHAATMLWRWLRSNRDACRGAELRGVPAKLRDVAPRTPRGDSRRHPMKSPLQAQGQGGGAAWRTNGRGGKVHPSFAESSAMPTRTTTTRGRRKRTIIHEASSSRPGMVHPVQSARPCARTPGTWQASESTNHLPAESRREPDRSTACSMRDTCLTTGALRGNAPPWVCDGRRRSGGGEGRSWRTPLSHGAGGDAQVLLLTDAAREST